jgi:hypothetical protein
MHPPLHGGADQVLPHRTKAMVVTMDQISKETPNPKCQLFLKIDQKRYLAEGVYLSEAHDPLPPCYTLNEYMYPCTYSHKEGGGVDEPVRRLEGRSFTRGVENTNMTVCISSLQTLLNTRTDAI